MFGVGLFMVVVFFMMRGFVISERIIVYSYWIERKIIMDFYFLSIFLGWKKYENFKKFINNL